MNERLQPERFILVAGMGIGVEHIVLVEPNTESDPDHMSVYLDAPISTTEVGSTVPANLLTLYGRNAARVWDWWRDCASVRRL